MACHPEKSRGISITQKGVLEILRRVAPQNDKEEVCDFAQNDKAHFKYRQGITFLFICGISKKYVLIFLF